MNWNQIRTSFPSQWVIVEALEAHTDSQGKRIIAKFAVIEQCTDGQAAFQRYRQIHSIHKENEYYYLHTSREHIDIEEENWVGIRVSHAIAA
jgi:hypothetical protein